MYTIQIVVYCLADHAEILPDALEQAACTIEERVGLMLLELFGNVHVDTVNVTYTPSEDQRGNCRFPAA